MNKRLFLLIAATLLLGGLLTAMATEYDAIVTNDSTGQGIDSVRVTWVFPDNTYITYTDTHGRSTVDYTGSAGNDSVSVYKPGYHPVHPPSGTINSTTRQLRYLFTMMPN